MAFLDRRFDQFEVSVDHEAVFVQITHNETTSKLEEVITNVTNFFEADDTSIIDYM